MTQKIKADKMSLKFQNKQVLTNISFELEGNKIYGLLGRNGAGKTSLLSVLAAFVKPTIGSIKVDGEHVFENAQVMEQIIFIRDVKLDDETGKAPTYIKDVSIFRPNFDMDYAERLIKRFKLPTDTEVSKLSRGMQSALHAIIGLASRCPITIFDEAYLGMDASAREIFYEEVLNDFMEHPRTIILSTHLISEMESMFEEVLIIDQGELILHEEAETLRESGVSVTGAVEQVDYFVQGKHILKEQVLGGTKLAMIYGQLSEQEREEAKAMQLTLGPITLQELFIHLTKEDKQ
ncbi:ABC transporter ATP-binding protein [Paenibacillus arenosi]|uniref:ABC transporter ATP-binding protein n=1 Tax=Paenibacillus arenosi TaxID=2774142 RepID=A0ABR9AWH8_9BACL|nr:ABC transporter ATP-binding protein [Paenibacillus arenosi]MBD8498490.1 ABC transporter ATP-binding protein [Paenibacillus arenosi]